MVASITRTTDSSIARSTGTQNRMISPTYLHTLTHTHASSQPVFLSSPMLEGHAAHHLLSNETLCT